MGQNVGSGLSETSGSIRSTSLDVARIVAISWEDFLQQVLLLNERCATLVDANGKYLLFALKKGSADSYLWKATVRICCLKMNVTTKKVESRKFLSLGQFLRLYKSLLVLIEQSSTDHAISTSTFLIDGLSQQLTSSILVERASNDDDRTDECVVCFERRVDVILPCTHSYCLVCIESWKETGHPFCPLCRCALSVDVDDSWVISECPDRDHVTAYLVSLADK